ncbi:MAG: hypothetical protein KAQ83_00855 [Nanoarchaeota archaeon]|nr:hypothetical protein [Nanoarchaeota archaeon]
MNNTMYNQEYAGALKEKTIGSADVAHATSIKALSVWAIYSASTHDYNTAAESLEKITTQLGLERKLISLSDSLQELTPKQEMCVRGNLVATIKDNLVEGNDGEYSVDPYFMADTFLDFVVNGDYNSIKSSPTLCFVAGCLVDDNRVA